ncbi:hypothetical protein [Arenimonas oryziterrae]|uniref:hypothetical protein n=1 Tax=Arenimonas oryziterrae TaxID=498055 RepID=UPI0009DB9540|nr:hypothetical protein [Arenimonas oryziterrae]
MHKYPHISSALKTIFNCEDGLSVDVATALYRRNAENSGYISELKAELEAAFSDYSTSWKGALLNDAYEVFDAESEEEARDYAKQILWDPIFGP